MVAQALVAPQQQPTNAVEGVTLATTVTPLVLLHPPADVVDGRVGQADHVKWIHDEGGVGQLFGHAVGIAPVGVDGHGVDPGQPCLGAIGQPFLDHRSAATSDDVEQPSGNDVDEAGDEGGVASSIRPQPCRLVQAQPAHGADALGIVDQWLAVVAHGVHDRPPADAEGAAHLGHGMVVPSHPPTRLDPGPLSEGRPRGDERAHFGPGLHVAVVVTTAPQTLAPDHDDRPPAAGEVTHLRPAPTLGQGSGPTTETADCARLRLHQLEQLAVHLDGGQQHETLQAQYRDRALTTLESHQGPPRFSVA